MTAAKGAKRTDFDTAALAKVKLSEAKAAGSKQTKVKYDGSMSGAGKALAHSGR